MPILNAKILSTSLGYEDHGILTFNLEVELADDGCCCIGGYVLDEYDSIENKRIVNNPLSLQCLVNIMQVVGVNKWEDLKNQYLRVEFQGWGTPITKIGNLMKDKWFDIKDFFIQNKE